MTKIGKEDSQSRAEAAKLRELCNIVLKRADVERNRIINDARDEIDLWVKEQQILLEAECGTISKDAKKRADEISTRQISDAKNEINRERLKLQNKCVYEAKALFQKKLEAMRKHVDYKYILAGLALEAIEKVNKKQDILLRLSAEDVELGEEIAAIINEAAPINIIFDSTPGKFAGGVMISSADGHWSVVSDWNAKTDELADTISARVLAVL
jgi:vacuolar-type H+-ATPase subunit E/Vma4